MAAYSSLRGGTCPQCSSPRKPRETKRRLLETLHVLLPTLTLSLLPEPLLRMTHPAIHFLPRTIIVQAQVRASARDLKGTLRVSKFAALPVLDMSPVGSSSSRTLAWPMSQARPPPFMIHCNLSCPPHACLLKSIPSEKKKNRHSSSILHRLCPPYPLSLLAGALVDWSAGAKKKTNAHFHTVLRYCIFVLHSSTV